MNFEEALSILYILIKQDSLTDVQELVFHETWRGRTYAEMADNSSYDAEYLKFVGFELWRLLSQEFGEKVTKSDLHSVFRRKTAQILKSAAPPDPPNVNTSTQQSIPNLKSHPQNHTDWGEAVDTSVFYGRTQQIDTLEQWIVSDRSRLVALLGIGGIGKTALSVKLTEQIKNDFEYVIWRSLRNAPVIKDILAELIQFLSNQQETQLPEPVDSRISLLINYLRSSRCLLVLDNFETVLQSGKFTGYYRKGY